MAHLFKTVMRVGLGVVGIWGLIELNAKCVALMMSGGLSYKTYILVMVGGVAVYILLMRIVASLFKGEGLMAGLEDAAEVY